MDGIAQAMEASAGQALVVFKEDPKYDALVVPGIEAAFVDATKLAGFVATGFVLFGVLFSLLLPKTQMHQAPDHEPVAVDGDDRPRGHGEGPEPEPGGLTCPARRRQLPGEPALAELRFFPASCCRAAHAATPGRSDPWRWVFRCPCPSPRLSEVRLGAGLTCATSRLLPR